MALKLELGDYITTKKPHPCGSNEFEMVRLGADLVIKCRGCGKEIWIPRVKLEKRIKKIMRNGTPVPK